MGIVRKYCGYDRNGDATNLLDIVGKGRAPFRRGNLDSYRPAASGVNLPLDLDCMQTRAPPCASESRLQWRPMLGVRLVSRCVLAFLGIQADRREGHGIARHTHMKMVRSQMEANAAAATRTFAKSPSSSAFNGVRPLSDPNGFV